MGSVTRKDRCMQQENIQRYVGERLVGGKDEDGLNISRNGPG